ncbi:2'-5' RNA ligase family protein [Pseudomonas sp. BMS12]|uniref:2'-5' RNA ligase family protein n=1 Tax=Pseudomonas sp. BMS12 TaxID=1796033 RepID=UPI00083AB341|nr:2'-5' RNA ligase family protein [Pseudomonas sp. BMS12]
MQRTLDGYRHSLVSAQRDYPEWHRGRPRYALWAIEVASPAILARLHSARELLGDWLHPAGQRQAHITLFVCGFPCQAAGHDDDIPLALLEAQRIALQRLHAERFELHIGGLDSFASAPFLRVEDPQGRLPALRQALAAVHPEIRQAAYLPHLTLGLYRRRISPEQWHARSAALRDCPALSLPVTALQLASYRAAELQGALRYDSRVALHPPRQEDSPCCTPSPLATTAPSTIW